MATLRRRMGGPFRRQLTAYSPITLLGLSRSAWQLTGLGEDPRPGLGQLLREEYGADEAILFASGTMALQVGLQLAVRAVGDSALVALPAFTCYDVGTAAVGANARVVLYDLDPATLSPDMASLERALGRGARVVVISPLYGLPLDWEALEARAGAHGAVLIEDAAQGHGATWRGRRLGSLGSMSVLSFARGKGWSGGSGGALLVRGDQGAMVARGRAGMADELEVLVKSLAQWSLGRPSLYGVPAAIPWLGLGETRYREPRQPTRMTRTAAALIRFHREAAKREAAGRRANAAALLERLEDALGFHTYRGAPGGEPGYLRLPLRLPRGMAGFADPREAILAGIAPSYPSPLSTLPPVSARTADGGPGSDLRGARDLARTLVTLPTHSWVGEEERARLLRLLDRYEGGCARSGAGE